MSKALLLALATLSLAAAGCSDGGSPTADSTNLVDDEEFKDFEATATTGVIRGLVIDTAIRPLAGVEVRLTVSGDDKSTLSTESGAFGFEGLEPGDYFLEAKKAGYQTVQANAQVVAGESEPPLTKIILTADPASTPYVVPTQYSGYIECSFRVGGPGGSPSVGVNACNGVCDQDVNMPLRPFEGEPDFVQGEMVWETTQTLGSGLSFVVGPPNCDDFKFARADGASPLVIAMDLSTIQNASLDYNDEGFDPVEGICYRAFSWVAEETLGTVGVVASQRFEVFYHAFYNMVPPEGWQFSRDGPPLMP